MLFETEALNQGPFLLKITYLITPNDKVPVKKTAFFFSTKIRCQLARNFDECSKRFQLIQISITFFKILQKVGK